MAGMRRPVAVIIGMMGAGKTRVGKEAAQMMQLPFADAAPTDKPRKWPRES